MQPERYVVRIYRRPSADSREIVGTVEFPRAAARWPSTVSRN